MSEQKFLQCHIRTVLILTFMVGVSCFVIFRRYLTGGEPIAWIDIGSDTSQLYLPQYAGIINQLKSGDFSFWNWRDGFGVNMNLFNLTNPILMLVYAYGAIRGTEYLPGIMVYVLCFEMYFGSVFMYLYLSTFHFDEKAKCFSSYMYAFSGFLLVWGQHYQFGAIYVMLPLMLLFTERMLRNQKAWKALTIMTALVVINSMYTGYMTLLMCAGYVMFRLGMMEHTGCFHWLKKVVCTALAMLLGVGISAFSLFPSAVPIFTVTSRMKSDLTIWQKLFCTVLPRNYYKALYYRLFTTTGMGISDYHGFTNYYEDPCLFFSSLFILLAIQYVFLIPGMLTSKRNRILRYAAAAFSVLAVSTAAVGVAMNGFAGSFSRYMFLVMPYFAVISAETLHEILRRKKISLIALGIGMAFLVVSYRKIYQAGFYPEDNEHIKILLFSGLAMGILLFGIAKIQKRISVPVLQAALGIFLMMNVISDGNSDFQYRYSVSRSDYQNELLDADTIRAVRKIQEDDPEFYRIEKMYHAIDGMDAMVQDYPSVSAYNSTQNGNIQNYVSFYWPTLVYKDLNHYLYANGSENLPQSELTGVKYVLAKDKNAEIPGFLFDRMIGSVAVFKNPEVSNIATFYPESTAEKEDLSGNETGNVSMKIAVNFADRDTDSGISILKSKNSGILTGTIRASQDGYLFLAIPYENGWSISIDGSQCGRILADEGFTAVKISEGEHTFQARYECPGLKAGLCVTVISMAAFLVLMIYWKGHAERYCMYCTKKNGRKTCKRTAHEE